MINSFGILPINGYEIRKAFGKLANKNTNGWDGISSRELKTYGDQLITPLLLLFNRSLGESVFADALKHAEVVRIQKQVHKYLANNYPPISILALISKLFEFVIKDRMLEFLLKYKFFSLSLIHISEPTRPY